MSGIGCFPGKVQQAHFQNGGSALQWKPVQPVRYEGSPGSDDLPYSSSSEEDLTPQKPVRFTPAEEDGQRRDANDSITSSQQTTETTGTYESSDTTGTSRLPGLPSMGPQRGSQVEEERRQLAAVKEESAEGFEGSPLFAGLPVGCSPSSSVVLKKAAIPEPSPVVWELQEYGDKRRQQLKKEAWQLKRYEHLLNLLKEGLIDQADFQVGHSTTCLLLMTRLILQQSDMPDIVFREAQFSILFHRLFRSSYFNCRCMTPFKRCGS